MLFDIHVSLVFSWFVIFFFIEKFEIRLEVEVYDSVIVCLRLMSWAPLPVRPDGGRVFDMDVSD